MLKRNKQELAYDLWRRSGSPCGDDKRDWLFAEGLINDLGRYFSEEAVQDPSGLSDYLAGLLEDAGIPSEKSLWVLSVLDGAPEHRDAIVDGVRRASPFNGVHPQTAVHLIRRKTDAFYDLCSENFRLYGASLDFNLDARETGKGSRRVSEDSCIALFRGEPEESIPLAIRASLQLNRCLKTWNDERQLPWNEQLHMRVSIGPTIEQTIGGLLLTWRDEISVDHRCLMRLEQHARQMLYSMGVRANSESYSFGPPARTRGQEVAHAS